MSEPIASCMLPTMQKSNREKKASLRVPGVFGTKNVEIALGATILTDLT